MELQAQPIEILLVEDNPGDVYLTTDVLRESHVINRVSVVGDGVAALDFVYKKGEYADAPRPDLILLDLNLPKLDGRGVLERLKSDPHFAQIPVVVLTSSEAEKDIAASYQLKANCYVSKPVRLESFVAAIRSIQDFWLSVVKLPCK